jgi:CheY-like chemotaxis protein
MHHVLIVDDEDIYLQAYSRILSKIGFTVSTSKTAENIFDIVDKFAPAIILMDHNMPRVTGSVAITQLKGNPKYNTIPVVLISANTDIEMIATDAGANAYYHKSRGVQEFISVMEGIKGTFH